MRSARGDLRKRAAHRAARICEERVSRNVQTPSGAEPRGFVCSGGRVVSDSGSAGGPDRCHRGGVRQGPGGKKDRGSVFENHSGGGGGKKQDGPLRRRRKADRRRTGGIGGKSAAGAGLHPDRARGWFPGGGCAGLLLRALRAGRPELRKGAQFGGGDGRARRGLHAGPRRKGDR